MAEKRMFSISIIDSDAFLDMPTSTQSLYFHLGMRADDDGFINNPRMIMRIIKASEDDMNILIAKKFIIHFESGIIVIKHWKINNNQRADRKKATNYQEEFKQLRTEKNGSYTLDVNQVATICQPSDNQMSAQNRIDKNRLDKNSIIGQNDSTDSIKIETMFNQFWITYPKKIGKQKCLNWFKQRKITKDFLEQIINAIENQKQSKQWNVEDGKFIPHPYTWLNRGGWDDEIEVIKESKIKIPNLEVY